MTRQRRHDHRRTAEGRTTPSTRTSADRAASLYWSVYPWAKGDAQRNIAGMRADLPQVQVTVTVTGVIERWP